MDSKSDEGRMGGLERLQGEKREARRLAVRFALLWSEQRRLAERLAAIESSTAWAVVRRLSQLRQRLAPEGSRRQWCFRLGVRGLRLWRREGIAVFLRRTAHKLLRRMKAKQADSVRESIKRPIPGANGRASVPPLMLRKSMSLMPRPSMYEFRVAFVGSDSAVEAASMRYRAHHLIEALHLAGLEGTFIALEKVQASLPTLLSHDLIVLVRTMHNDASAAVTKHARQWGLPVVYDIDDYLFDPWVLPYVEALRDYMDQAEAMRCMTSLGDCLERCDYFTGSTSYLAERAAELGKESFVIRNGLNAAQLLLSRLALEQRNMHRRGHGTRIGYFSGSRTHQADFRVVYPALMRLLREEADARLVIVGQVDVGEFPGLALYMDQIELLPVRHWSELPAAIAGVDINLIPLELTPFNEGKSNLKYYEAGLLHVPSIASPTRIHCENIRPGYNGLLAQTPEEWYNALKELVTRPDRRDFMGRNAYDHVLQTYTPAAVGAEAVAAYRQILRHHRCQQAAA